MDIQEELQITPEEIKIFLSEKYPYVNTDSWIKINSYLTQNLSLMHVYESKDKGIAVVYLSKGKLFLSTLYDDNESYLFSMELEAQFNPNFKSSFNSHFVSKSDTVRNISHNYIFAYYHPDKSLTIKDGFFIIICDATYWSETHHLDEDIEFDLQSLFPNDQQPCDIDGSGLLAVHWSGDKESLTQYLLSLDFKLVQSFLDYCDEGSGKPVNIGVIK